MNNDRVFVLPNSIESFRFKDIAFYTRVSKAIAISIAQVGFDNIETVLGRWGNDFLPHTKRNRFERLINPCFIRRKLIKLVLRESLHYEQSRGLVGGDSGNSYVGEGTLDLRKKSIAASLQFLTTKTIKTENGCTPLIDLTMNNVKRFNELHVMNLGMQELAKDLDFRAIFLTITAPAEYHSNPKNGRSSWNKSYADEAHHYINSLWKKFGRSLSNRHNRIYKSQGDLFGFRVVEPHSDGTPHWHVLLYLAESNIEKVIRLAERHFAHSERALKIELIRNKSENVNTASPASYMSKYILKSLNVKDRSAEVIEPPEESPILQKVSDIDSWRAATGIRAYQKIGVLAGVTKWRTLRKMYNALHSNKTLTFDNPDIDKQNQLSYNPAEIVLAMRQCDSKSYQSPDKTANRSFADFIVTARKLEQSGVDLYYKENYLNQYNEKCSKIVGLKVGVKLLLLKSSDTAKRFKNTIANAIQHSMNASFNEGGRHLNKVIQERSYEMSKRAFLPLSNTKIDNVASIPI